MTEEIKYETKLLTEEYHKIFSGVYNDFAASAFDKYKFELPPLKYDAFIKSVEEGLMNCILLLENKIPVAFLAYTTAISEAIELNIIHCLGNEDLATKRRMLVEEFLYRTRNERKTHVVCYPMIGPQAEFIADLATYGFKFVGLAVLRFLFDKTSDCLSILEHAPLKQFPLDYEIVSWDKKYTDKLIETVHNAFIDTSDALFDPRFKTLAGTEDIVKKIINGVYGEFLPDAVSVLLYKKQPCGVCFINVTDGKLANLPIFAIAKEHQGKGIAKHLLKNSLLKLANIAEVRGFSEINTTTETDNYPALNMYRGLGFKEDYYYPQSYLPITEII